MDRWQFPKGSLAKIKHIDLIKCIKIIVCN